jgi:predicted outer membrane repeat protein
LTIFDSIFEEGLSTDIGGAIVLINNVATELTDVKLARNHGWKGAAIYVENSALNVQHCSITDNTAEEYGGGIFYT